MNMINEAMYSDSDNQSIVHKAKKVVKFAIKGTAYTAFLTIAVASSLHLYSNPEDRQEVVKGLTSMAKGIEAKINDSYYKLTGSTVNQHVQRTEDIAKQATHKMLNSTEESVPTTEQSKVFIEKTKKAGNMIVEDVKKHGPEFSKIIQKDTDKSIEKAKKDISIHIKDLRQYSGQVLEKASQSIKP